MVAPWLIWPFPTSQAKPMGRPHSGGWNPLRTHLAHCDGIILCQDNFWGVCDTSELELVCRLAILPVTQDFARSLHLLNLDRANGNPSNASQPLKISLVNSLKTEVLSNQPLPSHPGIWLWTHTNNYWIVFVYNFRKIHLCLKQLIKYLVPEVGWCLLFF